MKINDLVNLRLHNQLIFHHPFKKVKDVVSWLGAVQAQDYAGAKWSLGLRAPAHSEEDIDKAISERSVVRTWPMRGTLHFIASEVVHWMLTLLTPRIIKGAAGRYRQLELDDSIFNKSYDLLSKELQGGKQLMRSELYALLESNAISTTGQRGIHIINYLAQKQLLCHGIHNDKQATYVLLDEWIPVSKKLSREEALAEIALKYFKSHGPATLQDFIWWTGLKVTDAKEGLNSVLDQLESFIIDQKTYWMERSLPDLVNTSRPSVHLLPGFDEYMLGYTDRTLVVDHIHLPKIVPGNNGMFMPTIVINGKIEGLWRRTLTKEKILLALLPFTKFSKTTLNQIEIAAKKYSAYLGMDLSVQ
ncbi:winged helix DNA-binding domain-containing protein [Dyadobacter psychrotolerans]|uniref:Winged helix DNA-binding domain-containing protein n=1 Tax=Dyadobacter psychrotolerans TaxID=2541721 RepID=A0A4R5DL61_9BACT|nr:winged helix DNA-binding domain-containing protein [Dyadobacter psychrotolerans]TDE12721.1 winged helix DNA-binding domain-containing protein [Dyadobacter psychrotolerans]